MKEHRELAQSYRFRAEELRAIAELDSETPNRRILMNVAKDYERMAFKLDAISNKSLGKV